MTVVLKAVAAAAAAAAVVVAVAVEGVAVGLDCKKWLTGAEAVAGGGWER